MDQGVQPVLLSKFDTKLLLFNLFLYSWELRAPLLISHNQKTQGSQSVSLSVSRAVGQSHPLEGVAAPHLTFEAGCR